jgi:BASS family bile acid:Na+ symporter
MARGDLALSISLTGIISLVAVFTMPPLVAFFAHQFMGLDAPPVNVTRLGITMFLLTAVPVVIGLTVRHFVPKVAATLEPIFDKLSVLLFVVVVIGALAANWQLFVDNMPVLGPAMVALIVCMLAIGVLLGKVFSLNYGQATAIAIETGVQNATLGITVGSLIVEQASALPPFSMPSGFYGIVMYLVTIPFVWWRRSNIPA